MNYLVTHYKNLAEQLQARINHIQQCLYEMDVAAGGGGLNTPNQTPVDRITLPTTVTKNTSSDPFGFVPKEGSEWTYDGIRYRIRNGVREFYWVGKDGRGGWIPVDDDRIGS